ncbi:heavy-metal-associated domain-containing protein [uncultured Algibacter sp.]|uniref:heavy-metal-associated domain-containing protein n=1 Tax=uncultured Algibacter sp. TaxID=298659 RepID=UPI00262A1FAA|nr:heavy-metal-associated domain-containing protein [uncultured Algibacter sp.]
MKTILEIQNLKCGGCANTISKKVSNIEDVTALEINNENNTVSFNYENESTVNKVKELLNNIGYPVVGDKNALTTKAKSFVSCAIGRMNN